VSTDQPRRPLGPAVAAARRTQKRTGSPRPYERHTGTDLSGEGVVLAATRALLSVRTREEAADVLLAAIHDLGGAVIPARLAECNPDALDVDVSLGVGEPLLVVVPALSVAGLHLGHHLPALVQDALESAERSDVAQRQSELAAVDALTGVASRGQIAPMLAQVQTGDVVCMLDLDGFKALNDTRGHEAGDRALEEFGQLLQECVRAGEFCGRYGGDEFLLFLRGAPVDVARARMSAVARQWRERGWHGTTASVGIAVVGSAGGVAAGQAADQALLRAKRTGRDRVVVAEDL
jgi:diguanylate cyclase (GGDEF)-like protein